VAKGSLFPRSIDKNSSKPMQGTENVMWHLIEDFFDQNLFMKAFLGLGWLSVLIMFCSLVQQVLA
jgi:hypothetical protein